MAHPDLNSILNELLPFAQRMLSEHGEFYPYAVVMLASGELCHVGASIEGDDHPSSRALIDLLTAKFRGQAAARELRAAGLCYAVLITPPGESQKKDAICCALEHVMGESLETYLPYVRGADHKIRYEKIFANKRVPQFFVDASIQ